MTPRTLNLIIGFGGVFLIGVLMLAAASVLGSAVQRKEPTGKGLAQADTHPNMH